jgi:dihydrofolate reductase
MMAAEIDLVVVAAVAENGVIGADEGIPWHYPADLRHFKETTTGHPVVLGRRTFQSIVDRIGGPLPDRTSVVLTREGLDGDTADDDRVVAVGSVEAALSAAAEDAADRSVDAAYVAGGAAVYEQLLPRADRMVLTEVPERPDGDTHFPDWNREEWAEVERREEGDLAFVTYERV